MTRINERQLRQDAVKCVIEVRGKQNWQEALQVPIVFDDKAWADFCGGNEVPYEVYARKVADLNLDSLERNVVTCLFRLGYELEELEVEFEGEKEKAWGYCVWYKKHPAYLDPPEWALRTFTNLNERNASLACAMWKTEHQGDKAFSMLSLQMLGAAMLGQHSSILLHKTILYRKVVFAQPVQEQQVAA